MARYKTQNPPIVEDAALAEYLHREFSRVQDALDDLFNGLQEPVREFPPKQEPVVVYSDGEFDLGDGPGLYLRIDGQWYKLQMLAVAALYPASGGLQVLGQTPTVS